jgi:CubicO group peptidase (beta-lactamase class C family)
MRETVLRNYIGVVLIVFSATVLCAQSPVASRDCLIPANEIATLDQTMRDFMKQYSLKALIVQVRCDGSDIRTLAMGESMTGVPATPNMHYRNGAMAFTYMSTMLLELVDQQKVRLDDKLSKFYPDLPEADNITLKNLANMTSGYADYVYQPDVLQGVNLDPFRQWTPEQLIKIGITAPMMFEPGTNFGYSHTNYVILGRVLEKITGMPLAQGMQKYVFGPMGLKQTQSIETPQIPEPVLHTFSSERRADLHVPADVFFYEEATFWNPSWTTAEGAVQITDITDMSKSMEVVGSGTLLSKSSWQAQVGPNLVGFGHKDPKCPVCQENNTTFNYGLGVMNFGPWVAQTKSFAGSGGTVGYLSSRKLTISVVTSCAPGAFDAEGNYDAGTNRIFVTLANDLAPDTIPKELMTILFKKR